MHTSIRDVAKKADVSISTVSRALNGYEDVSEETRMKVQKVANELGYSPNISAKNLSSKKTKNVAILISGMLKDQQTDEFIMLMIKGAYSYFEKHNLTMTIYTIGSEKQKVQTYDEFCREHSLAGTVLMGLKTSDKYVETLKEAKTPCATIDIEISGENVTSVITNDVTAFEEITQYVINQNHKKLVLVYGRKKAEVAEKRFQGFKRALDKNGISLKDIPILYTDFLEEKAYEKVKKYIEENGENGATAFLCMSDLTALGAIRAIRTCGYSCPDDFSVTGFDGVSFLNYFEPHVATINQQIREKGYQAAKVLTKMVNNEPHKKTVIINHSLEKGNSVKLLK